MHSVYNRGREGEFRERNRGREMEGEREERREEVVMDGWLPVFLYGWLIVFL